MATSEISKPRRIELILRQIDSLPTLPVIATRLLSLTARDETHAREVIKLVQADPALTAKVLSLCRSADKGLRDEVLTVDKAVVLLGFNTIRNAVLSIKVFEFFDRGLKSQVALGDDSSVPMSLRQAEEDKRKEKEKVGLDHAGFWVHSLAVGVLAELIAEEANEGEHLSADEAFVCGLLHDVGKLALDHVLPKSYARVIELSELNHGNISAYERRIVGIDHHTAGKRLAEQWGLPHRLQDSIWLHGSPIETLPELKHKRMVGLVGLADLIVRQQHVGFSGNHSFKQHVDRVVVKLGLEKGCIERAIAKLHGELERRVSRWGFMISRRRNCCCSLCSGLTRH